LERLPKGERPRVIDALCRTLPAWKKSFFLASLAPEDVASAVQFGCGESDKKQKERFDAQLSFALTASKKRRLQYFDSLANNEREVIEGAYLVSLGTEERDEYIRSLPPDKRKDAIWTLLSSVSAEARSDYMMTSMLTLTLTLTLIGGSVGLYDDIDANPNPNPNPNWRLGRTI